MLSHFVGFGLDDRRQRPISPLPPVKSFSDTDRDTSGKYERCCTVRGGMTSEPQLRTIEHRRAELARRGREITDTPTFSKWKAERMPS